MLISSNQDNFIFLIGFHVLCLLERAFFPSLLDFSSIGLIGKIILALDDHSSSGGGNYFDPRFKRVLWYIISSTKGGPNRARILELINSHPANPNQISSELKLDYKTIIHHLSVLAENGLVITNNKESYGATYFLTPIMEKNYDSFVEILAKIGKK
jgi:DNA-binding transcriptional ArsR family regulator